MNLALTDEQKLIRDTAKDMLRKDGARRLRRLRDAAPDARFSRELWAEMGELGWLGLTIPEAHGGAGLGLAELALVLEELGRGLGPEPVGAALLLGAGAIDAAGSEAQKARFLPRLATGEALATLAWQEGPHRPAPGIPCMTVAEAQPGGGYRLTGEKREVVAGANADVLIVSARVGGDPEPRLFLVEAGATGLTREALDRVDAHPVARVALAGVEVGEDAALPGVAALGGVLDRATIGLAAEMLGGMAAALEMTLAWLRERRQFGVPIGSFQALQHRAARAFVELELTRSVVMAAARTADQAGVPAKALAQAASLAKARASDAFALIADEAVQMHGGIGMTDEHDVGLYLKRARVAAQSYGDAAWHRDRWARLAGY
ncbi:MAG: acyl-CoA dehydrogenase family protein [Deltaproteobacteria bacterium]|nr:acyl-CoA dehydrogenase family protein [Deltaproteobacteria bacterium]